jgi:hypothetical protein
MTLVLASTVSAAGLAAWAPAQAVARDQVLVLDSTVSGGVDSVEPERSPPWA